MKLTSREELAVSDPQRGHAYKGRPPPRRVFLVDLAAAGLHGSVIRQDVGVPEPVTDQAEKGRDRIGVRDVARGSGPRPRPSRV